jgi:hypothetical protein
VYGNRKDRENNKTTYMPIMKPIAMVLGTAMLLWACQQKQEHKAGSKNDKQDEFQDRGAMFVRDDLAFVRLLTVEVPIDDMDQLMLSNEFNLMGIENGKHIYIKKTDTWDMTVEISLQSESNLAMKHDVKIGSINPKITLEDIYKTLDVMFQESYGEASLRGNGSNESLYAVFEKMDDAGGCARRLGLSDTYVEVTLEAFSF